MRLTPTFLLLPTVALISGCAAQVIGATPRSVTVQAGSAMVGEATALAEKECQKQGLHARAAGKNSPNQFVFDCVQ